VFDRAVAGEIGHEPPEAVAARLAAGELIGREGPVEPLLLDQLPGEDGVAPDGQVVDVERSDPAAYGWVMLR